MTRLACPQRKEKYAWHPSFLKSSASAQQRYAAWHPAAPPGERPLAATMQMWLEGASRLGCKVIFVIIRAQLLSLGKAKEKLPEESPSLQQLWSPLVP